MKTQTVQELRDYLDGLCQIGKGGLPIYFDTEARTFEYHMALIASAYFEEEPKPHVQLIEANYLTLPGYYPENRD